MQEEMSDKTAYEVMGKFHKVAGKIASGWAEVESLVEAAVWEALRLEKPLGRMVTRHINFTAQLDILSDLLREQYPEAYASTEAEWNELIKKVHKLRRDRNAIVHGNWGGMDQYHESPVIVGVAYEPKNNPTPKAIPYTLKEMSEVDESIARLSAEIMNFIEATFSIHPRPPEVTIHDMVEIGKTGGKKN
jgi:hypothetical protein